MLGEVSPLVCAPVLAMGITSGKHLERPTPDTLSVSGEALHR